MNYIAVVIIITVIIINVTIIIIILIIIIITIIIIIIMIMIIIIMIILLPLLRILHLLLMIIPSLFPHSSSLCIFIIHFISSPSSSTFSLACVAAQFKDEGRWGWGRPTFSFSYHLYNRLHLILSRSHLHCYPTPSFNLIWLLFRNK